MISGTGGTDPVMLLQKAMADLAAAFQAYGQQAKTTANQTVGGARPSPSGGGGSNPGEMLGAMKTAALGAVTQVTDAVVGTLQSIFNQIRTFTEALNPALVMQISRAFRDLNAVIGLIAQEVGAMLLPIVRGLADALLPAMRALVPVVASVAETFNSVLQPVIDAFAKILEALLPAQKQFAANLEMFVEPLKLAVQMLSTWIGVLMPFIQAFAVFQKIVMTVISALLTLMQIALMPIIIPLQIIGTILGEVMNVVMQLIDMALAPFMAVTKLVAGVMSDMMRVVQVLMQAFQAVVKAVANAISGLLGFGDVMDIKDVMKSLQDAFRSLMKGVLMAVAMIMKMVGFGTGIDAMIKAIKGARQASTGLAVAESPAFKAIGDLGKDAALQALIASGQGTKAEEKKDWMADIAVELQKMSSDKTLPDLMKTMPDTLAKAIVKAMREAATPDEAIFNAVKNPIGTAIEGIKKLRGGR